jgi:HK97 family phage prohead protease
MTTKELRYTAGKLRSFDPTDEAVGEDAQRDMGGYAAVFNSPTVIAGYFREQIAPGAFSDAIKNCDVRALFNHDANFVIGRNVAKTLVLTEDDRGLTWRATPPATSWARDLAVSIDRGDISGCSFSFVPSVEEWDYAGDMPLRTIMRCDLYDVSAVTYPAYEDTSVALRTLEAHREAPAIKTLADLAPADRARIAARKRHLQSLSRA